MRGDGVKRFLHDHSLSLTVLGLFVVFAIGQLLAGRLVLNEERERQGEPPLDLVHYVSTPHALEALTENWESEFLQMAAFAILTAFLIQRGSAESKDPDREKRENARAAVSPDAPWPVHRGGWVLRVYEHSLSLSLGLVFVVTLALHAWSGAALHNEEQLRLGRPTVTTWDYLGTSQFWFESLQNWQSEFLSIGAMVILTIFLREKGSPESKRVETPHHAHD